MTSKSLITKYARELRRRQTKAEQLLWMHLRGRSVDGFKFLRQHPIIYSNEVGDSLFFIVDFYCHEARLVIEVDGGYHGGSQHINDKMRGEVLDLKNLNVMRIHNEEVEEDIRKVLAKIKNEISTIQSGGE